MPMSLQFYLCIIIYAHNTIVIYMERSLFNLIFSKKFQHNIEKLQWVGLIWLQNRGVSRTNENKSNKNKVE